MAETNPRDRVPQQPAHSAPHAAPHAMDEFEGGRPHAPADDKETVYYEGSPMIRGDLSKLVGCAFLAAVLIAIPILIKIFKPEYNVPTWLWVVLIALAIGSLILPFILVKARRYRISNYRIDFERGILGKKIDTLELWHVEDISFSQSLLGRIFNVGTVTVISHDDTTPELKLEGLPNPRAIFESLKQRVIAVKRQRGVVKMNLA